MRYIWLDDIREPPSGDWEHAKTFRQAQLLLHGSELGDDTPITISFDHDLSDFNDDGTEVTGYTLAKHIVAAAHGGRIYNICNWSVHSANPVGAQNIRQTMFKFDDIKHAADPTNGRRT
jgi:hypothetical protein